MRHSKNGLPVASCLLCYSKTLELNSRVGNEQWNRTHSVVIYVWTCVSFFSIIIVLNSTATCLCLYLSIENLNLKKRIHLHTVDGLINGGGGGGGDFYPGGLLPGIIYLLANG